jgi:hypothetical protein
MKKTKIEKPCRRLGYCPYGPLVENFPLLKVSNDESCSEFGHQCPVFTCAEGFVDEG